MTNDTYDASHNFHFLKTLISEGNENLSEKEKKRFEREREGGGREKEK